MNRSLLFFLASIFIFFSCSRKISSPVSSDLNASAPSELEFKYFSTKSSFKYKDDNENLDANATLRMKKDSIIWININAGLGIEAMRAMITPDSITIVDKLKKRYIVYDFKSLSERYNFNLDFNVLQNLLLGNAIKEGADGDQVKKEGKFTVWMQRENKNLIETFIKDKTQKVEKLKVSEPGTSNSLTMTYEDFSSVDGQIIPNTISMDLSYLLQRKEYNVWINLKHVKTEFSEKELKFPFSIPDKYERIE